MADAARALVSACEVRVQDEAWVKGQAELMQGSLTVIRQGGTPLHVELSIATSHEGIKVEEERHVLALIDGDLSFQLAWPSSELAEEWKKAVSEGSARIVDAADGVPTPRHKDRQKRSSIFLGLKKTPAPNLKKMLGMGASGSKLSVTSVDDENDDVASPTDSARGPFEALEAEALQIATFSMKDLNLGDITTPKVPEFRWRAMNAIKDYDTDEEDVLPPPDDFEGGEYSDDEGTETDEKSESESSDARKSRHGKRMSLQKRNATTFSVKKSAMNDEEAAQREQQRKYIAMEIYESEESYVKSISKAVSTYMDPLVSKAADVQEDKATVQKIFGNLKPLLGFNTKLMLELKKAIDEWTKESMIGPIFVKFAPFLKMYAEYSNKYSEAIATFHALVDKNQQFRELSQKLREDVGGGHTIPDLLIMPIQRIPRYSLLLRDLQEKTPPMHADMTSIKSALQLIEEVAVHVNEQVRRSENQKRVEEIQAKGAQLGSLIKPYRFMLKEGIVKVTIYNTEAGLLLRPDYKPLKEVQHFILFNDVFVHVKKDTLKTESDLSHSLFTWSLSLLWISREENRVDLKGPTEVISFEDVDGWGGAIEEALKQHIIRENKELASLAERKRQKPFSDAYRWYEYKYLGNHGSYIGDWVDGKRQGRGSFVVHNNLYKGMWRSDKRHGRGQLFFSTGDVYNGMFSDNYHHGRGRLTYSDGSEYSGDWVKGVRRGRGTLKYSNGDVYEGSWENDNINGLGKLTTYSGMVYEGQWKDGRYHGVGKLTLPSGVVYEGEFVNGYRQGTGYYKDEYGSVYKGMFEQDMKHGVGVFSGADGSRYSGHWGYDYPHGDGRMVFAGGMFYHGEWDAGRRHGHGICRFPYGGIYVGLWKMDQPHGEGVYTKAGYAYRGSWTNGRRDGKGTAIFPSGAKYTGAFFNDKFHKYGTYFGGSTDWIVSYDGEWEMGNIHGKGTLVTFAGDVFKGSFTNGAFDGDGTLTHHNGQVDHGKYDMGAYRKTKVLTLKFTDRHSMEGLVVKNCIHRQAGFPLNAPPPLPVVQQSLAAWTAHPLPANHVHKMRRKPTKVAEMDLVGESSQSSSRDLKLSPRGPITRTVSSIDERSRSDSRGTREKEKERENEKEKEVPPAKKSKSFLSSMLGRSKSKRERDEDEFVVSAPLHLMKYSNESTNPESEEKSSSTLSDEENIKKRREKRTTKKVDRSPSQSAAPKDYKGKVVHKSSQKALGERDQRDSGRKMKRQSGELPRLSERESEIASEAAQEKERVQQIASEIDGAMDVLKKSYEGRQRAEKDKRHHKKLSDQTGERLSQRSRPTMKDSNGQSKAAARYKTMPRKLRPECAICKLELRVDDALQECEEYGGVVHEVCATEQVLRRIRTPRKGGEDE